MAHTLISTVRYSGRVPGPGPGAHLFPTYGSGTSRSLGAIRLLGQFPGVFVGVGRKFGVLSAPLVSDMNFSVI